MQNAHKTQTGPLRQAVPLPSMGVSEELAAALKNHPLPPLSVRFMSGGIKNI